MKLFEYVLRMRLSLEAAEEAGKTGLRLNAILLDASRAQTRKAMLVE